MTVRVIHGDMLEAIPHLVAEGVVVDAVVTDPPYHLLPTVSRFKAAAIGGDSDVERRAASRKDGLGRLASGFMGQQWDGGDIAFRPETWATVATILRPGGFLLAFGGTRTHHRLWCAIEDGGLIIQDTILFLFGTGFPKRRDMLKPAFEPVCVAYKPGGKRTLQVDECRIPTEGISPSIERRAIAARSGNYGRIGDKHNGDHGKFRANGNRQEGLANYLGDKEGEAFGRWPANVIHDGSDEVLAAFAAFGDRKVSGSARTGRPAKFNAARVGVTGFDAQKGTGQLHNDTGTAARFFKCCPTSEGDPWNCEPANFAAACLNLQSEAAATVLRNAVAQSTLGRALNFTDYRAHNTSVLESELSNACVSVIAVIQSIAHGFLFGLQPQSTTATSGPAKSAATPKQTGIMTITLSLWTSNGFAERATFNITRQNWEPGEKACRFHYSSKANAQDRWGSRHPTVKPVELMKWLVALVTPPQGTVLDCFAGSGTTAVAAMATGRNAILIEQSAEYIADIRERVAFYEGEGRHSMVSKNRNHKAGDRTTLSANKQCRSCGKFKSHTGDRYGCRCKTPVWEPVALAELPLFPEPEVDAAE